MTHHIGKYGDIGNFSGVSSQICGDMGPCKQTNWDSPDFTVLNVPIFQPRNNTAKAYIYICVCVNRSPFKKCLWALISKIMFCRLFSFKSLSKPLFPSIWNHHKREWYSAKVFRIQITYRRKCFLIIICSTCAILFQRHVSQITVFCNNSHTIYYTKSFMMTYIYNS